MQNFPGDNVKIPGEILVTITLSNDTGRQSIPAIN